MPLLAPGGLASRVLDLQPGGVSLLHRLSPGLRPQRFLNETGCRDQHPSTVMKTANHGLEETSCPEPTLEEIKQAFDRLSTCRSLRRPVLLPKTSQQDTDGEIEQAAECGRGVRACSGPPATLIST